MRPVRVAAAVVAPLAVSAVWVAWLFVLAATHPTSSTKAKEIDAALDNQQPEVLLLGNSAANRGIDPDQLGKALGRQVTSVTIAATLAPAWYVILRDRVYARGLSPDLVVIADTPPGMLAVEPFSENLHEKMLELATGDDPVRARTDADKGPIGKALSTVSVATHRVRDGIVDGIRNAAVGLLFEPPGGGLATLDARGKVVADAAVEVVFHNGGIRAEGPEGALALDLRKEQDVLSVVRADPAESFVGDTIDLVESHGGRLVYVHLPRRSGVLDPVTFDTRAALVSFLNKRGVPFLDLSLFPDPELFADNNHLLPSGRVVLTDLLAAALQQRVLADEPFEETVVPSEQAKVTRNGTPAPLPVGRVVRIDTCTYEIATPAELAAPSLAALRVYAPPLLVLEGGQRLKRVDRDQPGCTGTFVSAADRLIVHASSPLADESTISVVPDPAVPQEVAVPMGPLTQIGAATPTPTGAVAFWVFPGTSLRIEDPMSPAVDGRVAVHTSALVVFPGQEEARLNVAGSRVPVEADGRVLRSSPVDAAGDRPLTVSWVSPPNGPFLLVRDLRVGSADAPRYVLGSAGTSAVAASFLPSAVSPVVARWDSDPPALVAGPVQVAAEGVGIFEILEGPWFTMSLASKVAGRKHCSPIVVDLDGLLLDARPGPSGVHFDLPPGAVDRASHARPLLHPERRCTWWPAERKVGAAKGAGPLFMEPLKTARWMYPGDRATFARADLAEMHATAGQLIVEGFRIGAPAALEVSVDTAASTEAHVGETEQGAFRWTFPLATPLDPQSTGMVSVRLAAPDDDGFFYLTEIELLESDG